MIIYKITNKINGKSYIGQTGESLEHRIAEHISFVKYGEGGSLLHKAIRKYSIQSFDISIIDNAYSWEILGAKEQYWIKQYSCRVPNGYNLTDGGEGHRGFHPSAETLEKMRIVQLGKHLSEETRRKIGLATKGKHRTDETRMKISKIKMGKHRDEDTRRKISKSLMGRHLTEDHRRKMSVANSGEKNRMFGKHHTEETKAKISLKAMGNKRCLGRRYSPETIEKISKAKRRPSSYPRDMEEKENGINKRSNSGP